MAKALSGVSNKVILEIVIFMANFKNMLCIMKKRKFNYNLDFALQVFLGQKVNGTYTTFN